MSQTLMPAAPKRGAFPAPAHMLAGATPHVEVGGPPEFLYKPAHISMWGNDVHGDCVTAEEAFAKACNHPEIFITDQVVESWAQHHGVLEGAYLYQVMDWMKTDGFHENGHVYDDGNRFTLNWTNPAIVQNAITRGPVKLGVGANQLLTVWRNNHGKSGWFATGFHAEPQDHCVSLCGYGTVGWLAGQLNVPAPHGVNPHTQAYAMFTWNSIGIIDIPSMVAITHEAWLRLPTNVVK